MTSPISSVASQDEFHAEAMHASGAEICHNKNAQQVMTQRLGYSHSHNDLNSTGDRSAIDEAVKKQDETPFTEQRSYSKSLPSQRQEGIETGHRQRIRQVPWFFCMKTTRFAKTLLQTCPGQ